jgi:hypothetical protein
MSDTGTLSPGTMANDASVGTNPTPAWANPDNAKSSNDSYAVVTENTTGGTSNYLKATNFGASIPVGSTINGIEVSIEKKRSTIGTPCYDSEVKIVKADGSIGSTNRADTVTAWATSDTATVYGSSSDTWGESWSSANINDVDFGVVINTTTPTTYPPISMSIDYISIKVYYTEGGSFTPKIISVI